MSDCFQLTVSPSLAQRCSPSWSFIWTLYLEGVAALTSWDVPHVLASWAPWGPGMWVLILPGWFSPFCWGAGRVSQGKTNQRTNWKRKGDCENQIHASSFSSIFRLFCTKGARKPFLKRGGRLLQLPEPGMPWVGATVFLQPGWSKACCRFELFLCCCANPGPLVLFRAFPWCGFLLVLGFAPPDVPFLRGNSLAGEFLETGGMDVRGSRKSFLKADQIKSRIWVRGIWKRCLSCKASGVC